jgi:hypothetical protein
MVSNSTQLSALSRLFSSSVFRELAGRGKSALFSRLVRETSLHHTCPGNSLVAEVFETALSILRTGRHRDEYVYKAALTQKVLLGTHSLKTACMINEFRVADCKADLVILNGTAAVYEIKSERDSLTRLARQIAAYKKVFARVNVIAGENHVDAVHSSTPEDVGVLCLSKRNQISTLREAQDLPERICPLSVFDAIRTKEAEDILDELGVTVPKVPNTVLRSMLREHFAKLRPADLHLQMVRTLKRTRNLMPLEHLIDRLPSSLHAAALYVPMRKDDHEKVVRAVSTSFREALEWA